MLKAVREAKRHSSWTRVNAPYEEALAAFVDAALSSSVFVADLDPFARRIAEAGRLSSLSQTALKCVSPGVADVYQGSELWDDSLVDPDNRRPVDFAARAGLLEALDARRAAGDPDPAALARELSGTLADGRAKLLLLSTLLRLRRERPSVFLRGAYLPLPPVGEDAEHVVALARIHEGRALLCLAPRLVLRLLDRGRPVVWRAQVPLPPELQLEWADAITGARRRSDVLDVSACLADFPVAVLTSGAWDGRA
jgi:(1->4)-alpha-D-glucan 1-alpha-D-glucosylmutase